MLRLQLLCREDIAKVPRRQGWADRCQGLGGLGGAKRDKSRRMNISPDVFLNLQTCSETTDVAFASLVLLGTRFARATAADNPAPHLASPPSPHTLAPP